MRWNMFARLIAAATFFGFVPAAGVAQSSATFNFSVSGGGFTAAGSAWLHSDTPPAPGGVTAWSALGQNTTGLHALESPAATITVGTQGAVFGSFTHRFNFAAESDSGEGVIVHDGGLIEYRVGAGSWTTLPPERLGGQGYTSGVPAANPLGNVQAFTGLSPFFDGPSYVTTTFTLGDATAAASFDLGDAIQIRFVAGFAGTFTTPTGANWQIGTVSLQDSTPVPEPAGVLALAALAVAGYRLRRRVTSATSPRTTAS